MTGEGPIVHKAVPKFASFRSRPDPPALSSSADETKRSSGSADRHASTVPYSEDPTRYSHRKHTRHEHGPKHQRHRESEGREGGNTEPRVATVSWNEPEIYAIDKIGDDSNLKYGSLHSYSIPSYFRAGYGSILGLSSSLKIDRQFSNEKQVVVSDPSKNRYIKRDKAVFAKVGRGRETRVKSVAPASKSLDDQNAEFLPVNEEEPRKRRRLDDARSGSGSSTEDEQHHYRSIEGKAKPSMIPEHSDINYNADAFDAGRITASVDEVNLRRVGLARKVELEPGNGDAWLDLIEYQEHILGDHSLKQRASAAERTSTADIKLSMYEKALNLVKGPEFTERLILGMMQEGAKVWDIRKIADKWQNVLQRNPNHINVWAKYLDFQQTNSVNFHFDELREIFIRCLGVLREAVLQAKSDAARRENLITIQIFLLLRLTICLREAGFSEQSIAIWQVVFEFNCCEPAYSGQPNGNIISSKELRTNFEDFWESEVPRIGEEGSVGWRALVSQGGSPPEPRRDETIPISSQNSFIENWYKYENARGLQSQQPARTIDETGEDDPFRVVLFSDVKDFAFSLPSSSYQMLFCAFLAYSHLPPPEGTPDHLKLWWQNPFVRNDSLYGFEKLLRPLDSSDTTTSKSITDPFNLPVPSYATSTDSLFSNNKTWFSAFHFLKPGCRGECDLQGYAWTRRVLRTLIDYGIGDDTVAEYLLAFEYNTSPSTAKKTAKTLLKKRPSDLRLYNAYALLEFRLGNRSIAESVLATAINMSKTLENKSQKETILLWRTWIWELLESADTEDALRRILTIPAVDIKLEISDVVVNPAANLRAQKSLVEGRDQAISLGEYRYAVLYSECLILLEYLANERSIDTALSGYEFHFQLFTNRLPPRSPHHELLHQNRAKLLYYHITHTNSFKPALIRSTLTDSIQHFPHNTVFLSLYAWNEMRFRVDDRVRSLVHDIVLSSHINDRNVSEDIIPHFFAVYTELRRSPTAGSNIHSIRGVFERAVESACGSQSAAMWKLYFLFECERGDFQKATAIFYRAVRACPWVKELYLLAFERLGKEMSVGELRGVYEMVVERDLRVFVGLEEVFEELDERG